MAKPSLLIKLQFFFEVLLQLNTSCNTEAAKTPVFN